MQQLREVRYANRAEVTPAARLPGWDGGGMGGGRSARALSAGAALAATTSIAASRASVMTVSSLSAAGASSPSTSAMSSRLPQKNHGGLWLSSTIQAAPEGPTPLSRRLRWVALSLGSLNWFDR